MILLEEKYFYDGSLGRYSDNQIFSVGDKVRWDYKEGREYYTIKEFYVNKEQSLDRTPGELVIRFEECVALPAKWIIDELQIIK